MQLYWNASSDLGAVQWWNEQRLLAGCYPSLDVNKKNWRAAERVALWVRGNVHWDTSTPVTCQAIVIE
jgi:hypothetical protein